MLKTYLVKIVPWFQGTMTVVRRMYWTEMITVRLRVCIRTSSISDLQQCRIEMRDMMGLEHNWLTALSACTHTQDATTEKWYVQFRFSRAALGYGSEPWSGRGTCMNNIPPKRQYQYLIILISIVSNNQVVWVPELLAVVKGEAGLCRRASNVTWFTAAGMKLNGAKDSTRINQINAGYFRS